MAVTLVVFCAVLLVQRDFWVPALVTLALVLMAAGVFADQFGSLQRRFATVLKSERIDSDDRYYYWHAARQLYAQNPVWGIEPGHFDIEFSARRRHRSRNYPCTVHND